MGDLILATGPMGSGTRLLSRVLAASGATVVHDASHGTAHWDARTVVIVRDPAATRASRDRQQVEGDWPDRQESLVAIVAHYPDALWVTYEQLCAAPEATIGYLAPRLSVNPWPVPEPIVNRNV